MTSITSPFPNTCPYKRVLVAGGAGFLGLHLCHKLLNKGYQVICLDNFYTSERNAIAPLLTAFPCTFELIRHDITEPFRCEVDEVYNFACPASPVHYQYNAIKTTKVSFLGTIHLLGLAKRVRGRILHASTSEIYGDPEVSPQFEEYVGRVDCTGVRACYDEGKRVAETLCFEYMREHALDVRVARIFNTYGPGMHPYDGRVVSNFIMQALAGEPLIVYGDGQQTRSFCYVSDMIDGLFMFMESENGRAHGPINFGNPEEITILSLANLIIQLTGSSSTVQFAALPNQDPRRRLPDIRKARTNLNWEPKVMLEEGLKKTIAYFKRLDVSKYKRPTTHTAHLNSDRVNRLKTVISESNE